MSKFPPVVPAENASLGIDAKEAPASRITRVNSKQTDVCFIHLHLVGEEHDASVFLRDRSRSHFSNRSMSLASQHLASSFVITSGASVLSRFPSLVLFRLKKRLPRYLTSYVRIFYVSKIEISFLLRAKARAKKGYPQVMC